MSKGGVDPGLLSARKILKLTWDEKKKTVDRKYRVPDQVTFAHHTSCVETTTHKMFTGTKSYQDKLKVDVETSGEYMHMLFMVRSVKFEILYVSKKNSVPKAFTKYKKDR